ncbi:hypothetical protein [Streptomyces sp. NPDC047043]|uniref:hypothetical protein n=1 Tax=Streptomyces sp. NPDC047043 TaxID=3154497 RepID=UPI0033DF3EB2
MSDRSARGSGLPAQGWFVRARVRIVREHQSISVDPLELRIFRPYEELEMVQWGRAGDAIGTGPWWTTRQAQAAHIVPAEKVKVLEVLEQREPG